MAMTTVTSKGQITLPASVRTKLGLKTGGRVGFVELSHHQFAIVAAHEDVRTLRGLLCKPAVPVSVEQMNAAIAARGACARCMVQGVMGRWNDLRP
ncbi:Putative transcriptional regulator [Candidatus Glomeribacter gigasporarum BEG34]|uniref:Putative transcriptional regulator n=1 Tax=Candidatus Glomeribacter gigasporarum BEG34 TaxID=1070319 RepID=G2J9Q5_9BURK|nr:AbrB/MazE/SpoVT family DNA-binding domain-containing protein [Candidatus Glomeribacter gigasporarum]CCD29502.1 Putative transcriptional regulator [Candidatus Glomeribacter gigasporarum BEG34]